jgi:hypothetical protein
MRAPMRSWIGARRRARVAAPSVCSCSLAARARRLRLRAPRRAPARAQVHAGEPRRGRDAGAQAPHAAHGGGVPRQARAARLYLPRLRQHGGGAAPAPRCAPQRTAAAPGAPPPGAASRARAARAAARAGFPPAGRPCDALTLRRRLFRSLDVLSYLLSVGADLAVRSDDDDACTALHCAAAGGSAQAAEAIKTLLLFGAERDVRDAHGRRAADLLPVRDVLAERLLGATPPAPPSAAPVPCGGGLHLGGPAAQAAHAACAGLTDLDNQAFATDAFKMY